MATPSTLTLRTFPDRAEALSHFLLRAGEAPRLIAYDDAVGCPMEMALPALEWTGAVGVLLDDDCLHAARLTVDTAAAVIERRGQGNVRQYIYLGPRMEGPAMDVFEGSVIFDEPGVRAIEFVERSHALAHFLRATSGSGALLSLLSRRAPELRHLRRWLPPALESLDLPRPMVGGWFAASSAGCLFAGVEEQEYRYIEVGMES